MTLLKAQLSSLVSTITDFLLTHFLTEAAGIWYLISSVIGTTMGGFVNFLLGRHWVFKAKSNPALSQAGKYLVVWIGSLILNTTGVYVFTEILLFHYLVSKVLISLMVGIFFNFLLQKMFVFKTQS